MNTYRVDITHTKDFTFNVRSGAHECIIDSKNHEGLTPPDAFLMSLGSCIGVYLRKYADTAGLDLAHFKITVEAQFQQNPLCFKTIDVQVELQGATLDERRKTALLGFMKKCPVHNTLKENPRVEIMLSEMKNGDQGETEK